MEGKIIFIFHKSKPLKKKEMFYCVQQAKFGLLEKKHLPIVNIVNSRESLRTTLLKDEKVFQLFCLLNLCLGKTMS